MPEYKTKCEEIEKPHPKMGEEVENKGFLKTDTDTILEGLFQLRGSHILYVHTSKDLKQEFR